MGYMTSVWSLVACFGWLQDRTQIPRMNPPFSRRARVGGVRENLLWVDILALQMYASGIGRNK